MNAQRLLALLLVRPELMTDLREDPERFAAAHGAGAATARQLASLPEPGLRLTSSIARSMRRQRIAAAFPGTFALATGPAQRGALLDAATARGEISRPLDLAEAGRLLVAAAGELSAELREMAAYEELGHRARHLAVAGAPGPAPGEPALAPGVLLGVFGRPVATVRRMLVDGGDGTPAQGTTHYAVRASGDPLRVRAHRLPPPLARLLGACDGSRTVAQIADAAGLTPDQVTRTVRTMAAKGFVTWRGAPASAAPRTPGGN